MLNAKFIQLASGGLNENIKIVNKILMLPTHMRKTYVRNSKEENLIQSNNSLIFTPNDFNEYGLSKIGTPLPDRLFNEAISAEYPVVRMTGIFGFIFVISANTSTSPPRR